MRLKGLETHCKEEYDPSSERTHAQGLTHACRTNSKEKVAKG